MENEIKTTIINLRVSEDFKRNVQRCTSDFGHSVSEVLLFGLNVTMAMQYDALIKHLMKQEAELIDGPKKSAFLTAIKKAKKDKQYFIDAQEGLAKKTELYTEIEALEAYRDFLSETVTAKA